MTIRAMRLAALALMLSSARPAAPVLAQSGFEVPPVFKASDVAPPAMLRGRRFTVDERVPVVLLLMRFIVRSDFGVFEAHGRDMLATRVIEVHALDELDKTSKTEEFLKAAGSAAARPVKAAANMVM